jgi:S-formylglutathione hydrolase
MNMKKTVYFILVATLCLASACCWWDLPDAGFTYSASKYEVGDTIYFQNISTNANTYEWDFGDGSTSIEENPVHIFNQTGKFKVVLKATNKYGSKEASVSLTINEQTGTLINTTVFSSSLEGNLLDDSPDRDVSIYLPPDYGKTANEKYPVIYLLHGYTGTDKDWFSGFFNGMNLKKLLDQLIISGTIKPMIVVCPSSHNTYLGSWYTNSTVSGNWEDFIYKDLVSYIDQNFQTIANPGGRGISGHSMGGYGALKLAMKHPDIFGLVYAHNAGFIAFEKSIMGTMKVFLNNAVKEEADFNKISDWEEQCIIAAAVAFAPNPSIKPFQCEFPIDEYGVVIDSIWQKWLNHDLCSMIQEYKANLLQLGAIAMDCASEDDYFYSESIHFSEALTRNGIELVLNIYSGYHNDVLHERMENHILPFFSLKLQHE